MPVFSLDRKLTGKRKPWSYSGARLVNKQGADGILASGQAFASATDGATVYKEFTSMHIPAGQTVTVSNRCKGLVIRCFGNCIIDGTLSMTDRGCQGAGQVFAPHGIDQMFGTLGLQWVVNRSIGATGGAGGARRTAYNPSGLVSTDGANGAAGVSGASGGGGSGRARIRYSARRAWSGAGAAGTTWSGGAAGGGCHLTSTGPGTHYAGDAAINGGVGGSGLMHGEVNGAYYERANASAGGGAGNPGGAGHAIKTAYPGGSGTGGLLILIVEGNLTINGTVQSRGASGGAGYAGGGSSGGGSITLIHRGILTNSGTVTAAGGASVSGGGAGGNGSVRIYKGWVW